MGTIDDYLADLDADDASLIGHVYDVARTAYCVIATGERRFYGCFVFKKGVIAPEA